VNVSEYNTGPGNDGKRGSPSPQVYIVILCQCVFVCRSVCVCVVCVCVYKRAARCIRAMPKLFCECKTVLLQYCVFACIYTRLILFVLEGIRQRGISHVRPLKGAHILHRHAYAIKTLIYSNFLRSPRPNNPCIRAPTLILLLSNINLTVVEFIRR
jgi:hypothetical protein